MPGNFGHRRTARSNGTRSLNTGPAGANQSVAHDLVSLGMSSGPKTHKESAAHSGKDRQSGSGRKDDGARKGGRGAKGAWDEWDGSTDEVPIEKGDPNYVDEEAEFRLHDPESIAREEQADAVKDEGNTFLKGTLCCAWRSSLCCMWHACRAAQCGGSVNGSGDSSSGGGGSSSSGSYSALPLRHGIMATLMTARQRALPQWHDRWRRLRWQSARAACNCLRSFVLPLYVYPKTAICRAPH